MKQFLTIKDMERICQEINDKHIPDDTRFMQAIEEQFEQYGDASRDKFVSTAFKRKLSVIDKEVKRIEEKVKMASSCFEGCSHCCYFPIIVTKMEAKLISQHIEEMPDQERQELIAHLENYYETEDLEQFYSIDFQTDHDFKRKYIQKQVACPLLDKKTNKCKAYEVRPIPCRTYLNYCDPQVCSDNDIPDEVFSYEFLYEYYMYALVNTIQEVVFETENDPINLPNDVYEVDYLPRLLKEQLPRLKGER